MSDLESKLAEARERISCAYHALGSDPRADSICDGCDAALSAFDACDAIASEIVAQRDAEIARLTRMIQTPRIIEDEFEDKG
jgi:hypothetical protein